MEVNEALGKLNDAGAIVELDEGVFADQVKEAKATAKSAISKLVQLGVYDYYGRGQGNAMYTWAVHEKVLKDINTFLDEIVNKALDYTKGK